MLSRKTSCAGFGQPKVVLAGVGGGSQWLLGFLFQHFFLFCTQQPPMRCFQPAGPRNCGIRRLYPLVFGLLRRRGGLSIGILASASNTAKPGQFLQEDPTDPAYGVLRIGNGDGASKRRKRHSRRSCFFGGLCCLPFSCSLCSVQAARSHSEVDLAFIPAGAH